MIEAQRPKRLLGPCCESQAPPQSHKSVTVGCMLAQRALCLPDGRCPIIGKSGRCPIIGKRGHSDWPLCVLIAHPPPLHDNPLNLLSIVIAGGGLLINDKGWLMTSLWDGMLAVNQADTDCLIDPAAGMPHVPYDLRTGLKTQLPVWREMEMSLNEVTPQLVRI